MVNMDFSFKNIQNFLKEMSKSRKILFFSIILSIFLSIALLFYLANKTEYQVLFSNLSPEDGGEIIAKLKERKIPYKIERNGTVILVPSDMVYELRLTLASESLPSSSTVGFELFNNIDFKTTRFVQEINYRRALQGELARTINKFKEVRSSRVFIVLPKDSLFLEKERPASASIQLDLKRELPPKKLAAIVHLVASAVEGLTTDRVTVVDTNGRLIFKGGGEKEKNQLLNTDQLEYKSRLENNIQKEIQSMLEAIVGVGNAIVRVAVDVDFTSITMNQEEYDPTSLVPRSEKKIQETEEIKNNVKKVTSIDNQRGILPADQGAAKKRTKSNVITNYEINKIRKTIVQPYGQIKRISVAAVINGVWKTQKGKDGKIVKIYIPRKEEELKKFEDLIKKAVGYNEDRGDQINVSSIPFNEPIYQRGGEIVKKEEGILTKIMEQKKTIMNIGLVIFIVIFILRPLFKTLKTITIAEKSEQRELPPSPSEERPKISESVKTLRGKERVLEITEKEPEKAVSLIKLWLQEER